MKKWWTEFILTVKKVRKKPEDVYWYIQGTARMFLYDAAPWLIRKHILEQFQDRRLKAISCSEKGSCKFCGCKTDDLFFANKPCSLSELSLRNRKLLYKQEDPCYGEMMSRQEWETYKESQIEILKINKFNKLKRK